MQCPHCTFYKVDTESIEGEEVRELVPTKPAVGGAIGVVFSTIVIWFIGGVVAVIVGLIAGAILGNKNVAEILVNIWTIGCVVGGVYFVAACLKTTETRVFRKTVGYSHYCRHCGYSWRT